MLNSSDYPHPQATPATVVANQFLLLVLTDITEFVSSFAQGEATIVSGLTLANQIFNSFEDLPFPTVAAINGIALGGGSL